jgi:hypothetical protein
VFLQFRHILLKLTLFLLCHAGLQQCRVWRDQEASVCSRERKVYWLANGRALALPQQGAAATAVSVGAQLQLEKGGEKFNFCKRLLAVTNSKRSEQSSSPHCKIDSHRFTKKGLQSRSATFSLLIQRH